MITAKSPINKIQLIGALLFDNFLKKGFISPTSAKPYIILVAPYNVAFETPITPTRAAIRSIFPNIGVPVAITIASANGVTLSIASGQGNSPDVTITTMIFKKTHTIKQITRAEATFFRPISLLASPALLATVSQPAIVNVRIARSDIEPSVQLIV